MSLLSLPAAKTRLLITTADHDGDVQDTIDEAEDILGNLVGYLTPTTVTETVICSTDGRLLLSRLPVLSVTSVTPTNGTALTQAFTPNPTSGVLEYYPRPTFGGFYQALSYAVVYQSGRTSVPPALRRATKDLVAHLWTQGGRGGPRRNGGPVSEVSVAGYLLPNVVAAAIAPYLNVAGFA